MYKVLGIWQPLGTLSQQSFLALPSLSFPDQTSCLVALAFPDQCMVFMACIACCWQGSVAEMTAAAGLLLCCRFHLVLSGKSFCRGTLCRRGTLCHGMMLARE